METINTIDFGEVAIRKAVSSSTELAWIELSRWGTDRACYASIQKDRMGIFAVLFDECYQEIDV